MVIDLSRIVGGAVVVTVLGVSAWYFLLGPGKDQPSVTDLMVNVTGSDEAKAFLARARSVASGDTLDAATDKMGVKWTTMRGNAATTEYQWAGPGVKLSVSVDNARSEVREVKVE